MSRKMYSIRKTITALLVLFVIGKYRYLAKPVEVSRQEHFMPSPPGVYEEDPIETSGQFEGDIVLSPLQERNAVRNENLKWPDGKVPFTLPTFFGVLGRITVALAANEFARHTCVRLVPRTNETDYVSVIRGGGLICPKYLNPNQPDHVSMKREEGLINLLCYSMVGRMGGKQELSLAPGCHRTGIVAHEFMHALGFWHEQSRTDRDEYVTVRWENIMPGTENNFQKYSTYVQQTLDEEYDYSSVMHYSRDAFSKNNRPTIVPKNMFGSFLMGQRIGFSPTDLRKINKLYSCTNYS